MGEDDTLSKDRDRDTPLLEGLSRPISAAIGAAIGAGASARTAAEQQKRS